MSIKDDHFKYPTGQFPALTTEVLLAARDALKKANDPVLENLLQRIEEAIAHRRREEESKLEFAQDLLDKAKEALAGMPELTKQTWDNLETAPKDITLKDNAGDLVAWNDLSAKWQFFDKSRDSWINLYGNERVLSEELGPFKEA